MHPADVQKTWTRGSLRTDAQPPPMGKITHHLCAYKWHWFNKVIEAGLACCDREHGSKTQKTLNYATLIMLLYLESTSYKTYKTNRPLSLSSHNLFYCQSKTTKPPHPPLVHTSVASTSTSCPRQRLVRMLNQVWLLLTEWTKSKHQASYQKGGRRLFTAALACVIMTNYSYILMRKPCISHIFN